MGEVNQAGNIVHRTGRIDDGLQGGVEEPAGVENVGLPSLLRLGQQSGGRSGEC